MGFSKFSDELLRSRKISIENNFILEYMPLAPENYTKVYLMGLESASDPGNSLEDIALKLNLDAAFVSQAFSYWQAQGLVNFVVEPPSVEFLPVIPFSQRIKKYSKEKYKAFNDQLHVMIKDRVININEYNEYYNLMESYHIEDTALLTIIGYCIRLKGPSITYPYILTVAKNLAYEGCNTYDRVQEKLSEMDLYDPDLRALLKTLGVKRSPEHVDRSLLLKWKNEYGFNLETIIQVGKRVKKGGVQTLNMLLGRYYEHRLFSIKEIDGFEQAREQLFETTRAVLKILGLRYEQLDYIIETYVGDWIAMGFTADVLYKIADYCFKRNIRGLDGMNLTVSKFYKQGLITLESIDSFLMQSIAEDEEIKNLFILTDINRMVTPRDRDFYKTWSQNWKMPRSLLEYAASLSKDKANPLGYMNTVLAAWHEKNITTVEDAKKTSAPAAHSALATETPRNLVSRSLSAEELNAMFSRLDDDEL